VGDVAGKGRLGKKEAAETGFSVKKSIFANGKKTAQSKRKSNL
jgi:hypothetical protein